MKQELLDLINSVIDKKITPSIDKFSTPFDDIYFNDERKEEGEQMSEKDNAFFSLVCDRATYVSDIEPTPDEYKWGIRNYADFRTELQEMRDAYLNS